jgi:hypothetical protein
VGGWLGGWVAKPDLKLGLSLAIIIKKRI